MTIRWTQPCFSVAFACIQLHNDRLELDRAVTPIVELYTENENDFTRMTGLDSLELTLNDSHNSTATRQTIIIFSLVEPCLALPCRALPCLALPCLALSKFQFKFLVVI